MGLVLASMWILARLKVQSQESLAWGISSQRRAAGCHGHQEALV